MVEVFCWHHSGKTVNFIPAEAPISDGGSGGSGAGGGERKRLRGDKADAKATAVAAGGVSPVTARATANARQLEKEGAVAAAADVDGVVQNNGTGTVGATPPLVLEGVTPPVYTIADFEGIGKALLLAALDQSGKYIIPLYAHPYQMRACVRACVLLGACMACCVSSMLMISYRRSP